MSRPDPTNLDAVSELIEAERAQISHEIHDALLPLIFAASAAVQHYLGDLQQHSSTDRDTQSLQQASDWLQQALQTGRRLLTQTHPPELDDVTWDHAARQTLERLMGGQATFVWQIGDNVSQLPNAVAAACYRIVVEAARNAVRHGAATEIKITALNEPGNLNQQGQLILTVTDNGSGFDPKAVPADRFGIRSMTGRAKLVGGTLTVASTPGGPTTVNGSFPVETTV